MPNDWPTPSWGTPSINTLTCLPLNPSIIICMSEPTPPVSLILIPDTLLSIPEMLAVELCCIFASMATALNGDSLMRCTADLASITTSSSA